MSIQISHGISSVKLENIVQQNPQIPWDYQSFCRNENITWEIIQQHPEIPWNLDWYGQNPNISFKFVEQHPEIPWNYYDLSVNTMVNNKEKIRIQQYFMANIAVEITNHCLHPDNFFKLYDLGFHDYQYNK